VFRTVGDVSKSSGSVLVCFTVVLAACSGPTGSGLSEPDPTSPTSPSSPTGPTGSDAEAPGPVVSVPPAAAPACEHAGPGTEYVVGPGQAYAAIGDVPWAGLTAGDTVRIFWRDEPYREKFLVQGQGTEQAPIVVCGVAGPAGQLPVIDGEGATTSAAMGYATVQGQARGLIHISLGDDDEWGHKPSHIVIQGLHVRNASHRYEYAGSDGAAAPYFENAAGIFVERGEHITVRGVELESNGNGLFVASGGSEEVRSRDIVLEHSYVYGNGTTDVSRDRHHNIYTEADGMVFQFNEIGPLAPGALGAALKDRSAGTVVRYNRITGGSRSLDLVEAQDSAELALADPDYRTTLVYGNVFVNDAEAHGPLLSNMFHYGGDSGLFDTYRKGTLYFVHNTVVVRADQEGDDDETGVGRWNTALFDLDTPDETAVVTGNVFHVRSVTPGAAPAQAAWGRFTGTLRLGPNWASPGLIEWRNPDDALGGTIDGLDAVLSNVENAPGFVDEPGGDFAPAAGSPLVDAASELPAELAGLGVVIDREYAGSATGRARTTVGAPDLGAFESTGTAPGGQGPTSTTLVPASTGTDVGGTASAGPLPDDAPAYAGKGPIGNDNGERYECGAGVRCVGGDGDYSSINAAIGDAAAGDVVQVAGGTYRENVALGSFADLDPRHLTLLGGFAADFASRDAAAYPTVIDGGGVDPAVQLHVVSAGTTVLDGFVLTGGVGLGTDWEDGEGGGGGVHAQQHGGGELVISHNEVFGNRTRELADGARGGGIQAFAADWDGGAPTVRIEHNHIHDNEAGRGAGIEVRGRAAVLVNNLVERNLAHSDHGGGVYLSALANTVTDNIVRANVIGVTAGYGWGGGIFIGGVPATLAGNVVTDNYAPSMGSGVFWDEGATGTMTGDLVVANRCSSDARSGAAIYVDGGEPGPSRVVAERLTVVGHACADLPDGGAILLEGGSTIDITASILWGNGRDVLAVAGETFSISNSTTSVDADPQFRDPAVGDYALQPGSPATGQGAAP